MFTGCIEITPRDGALFPDGSQDHTTPIIQDDNFVTIKGVMDNADYYSGEMVVFKAHITEIYSYGHDSGGYYGSVRIDDNSGRTIHFSITEDAYNSVVGNSNSTEYYWKGTFTAEHPSQGVTAMSFDFMEVEKV